MNNEKYYTEEELKADSMLHLTNRQVNVSYILAMAFQQSCEDMVKYLKETHSDLEKENKQLMNELLRVSKRVMYLVDQLENRSILKCDDEAQITHDTFGFMMYSLIMHFLSVIGPDNCKPRAYYLYKKILGYKHHMFFPCLEKTDIHAWDTIIIEVDEGKWGDITIEEEAIEDESTTEQA